MKENYAAKLKAINGRADAHAEIQHLADTADADLARLLGAKKHFAGAELTATSGSAVANAYARKAFTRQATAVRLVRKASGWVLADVQPRQVWQAGGGPPRLILTPEQDRRAVEVLRQGYGVARS